MNKTSVWFFSAIFATILAFTPACASKPDDAKVTSEIQSKFTQDSGLSTKQLNVQASGGVVTLSGTVDNDAEREAAGRQAASVTGVKTVINNLQVGTAPMSVAASAPPAEAHSAPASSSAMDDPKPAAGKKSKPQPSKSYKAKASHADSSVDSVSDNNQSAPSPTNSDNMSTASNTPPDNQPSNQAPPPPPAPRKLIIDQGTQITVRLIDPIDSEKNQTGDTFHVTLNAAITSDGQE